MKKILLPTDFSENARIAADFTTNLFCGMSLTLNMYHFYGINRSSGSMLISIDDLLQKDANKSMNKEIARINNSCAGSMELTSKNLNGKLSDYINEIISNNKIDMVAMGTQGNSGFTKNLFGSNTTQLLNSVDIPVLVIPKNTKVRKLEKPKIAFASDFKNFKTESRLKDFLSLMNEKYDSLEKDVVFVSTENSSASDEEREFCDSLLGEGINNYVNIRSKDIASGLMKYMEEHQPDIMIMVHRNNSFFDRLLKTSLSSKMALNAGTPLLIFKD